MEETFANIAAMKSCHDAIKEADDFDLPSPTKEKFQRLAISMHSSRDLPNLKRLIEGSSKRDCFATLINARGYVEEGLTAAYYHYGNVRALEKKAIEVALHTAPPIPGKYGGTHGFGASEKFSFEYIAFTFALRRTMEYLAVSVAAFFNAKPGKKGFRGLKTTIDGLPPEEIGERIKKKHDEHMKKLSDIIAELRGWDPRSIFAHRRAADSWINICYTETGNLTILFIRESLEIKSKFIVSEEEIEHEGRRAKVTYITPVLKDQLTRVENLIFDFYQELGFQYK